jgi:GTP-sensing pleiotropic transcriptional regulator CodY
MNIELIIVALISGVFMLLSIVLLQRAWEKKLILSNQLEYKIAKIKNPQIKTPRRMPKGYKTQILEIIELLGNEKVQDLLGMFQEKSEDLPENNKLLETLIPIAQGFLQGAQEEKQNNQVDLNGKLYQP